MKAGIESISFYVPHCYLDLKLLAKERGVDPDKYHVGLGQDKMAVLAPDEDIITMGAHAAQKALWQVDKSSIDTVIFATESGIDQSKAASIYIHGLLDLPSSCRAFEIKQACCSSTVALQMAMQNVTLKPDKKVLVIASDLARYGLGATGEPTQGAGAVAMVISSSPRVVEIDPAFGSYTEDVMDFWRPNYRDEALVDGKYSIKIYLKTLQQSWLNYQRECEERFDNFDYFCYHLPFTRMGEKAHYMLASFSGSEQFKNDLYEQVKPSLEYNQIIGNSYTASLYIGLLSLLENAQGHLEGKRIGLFSYGSGCMGSFFSATVCPAYQKALSRNQHASMLDSRKALTIEEYTQYYNHQLPKDGSDFRNLEYTPGQFRLLGIQDHKRIYDKKINKKISLPKKPQKVVFEELQIA